MACDSSSAGHCRVSLELRGLGCGTERTGSQQDNCFPLEFSALLFSQTLRISGVNLLPTAH